MRFIDTPLYGQQIMIILFILAFILSIFDTIMAFWHSWYGDNISYIIRINDNFYQLKCLNTTISI